jgi:hypothetical protein
MKVFVGFGYNEQDQWIEERVFPVLQGMGFTVVDGKDMHGQELSAEVKSRIEQSDAAIGFFTIRAGQENAEFNSHIWVRDEMVHAVAKGKPILPVKEDGAKLPPGLLGNRQYIPLNRNDKLACVAELVKAIGSKHILHLRLETDNDELRRKLHRWTKTPGFTIRYQTRDVNGMDSDYRNGRLEEVDHAFYLNVSDVPKRAMVDVEGMLDGAVQFSSGWVSANAVQVKIS